MYFCVCSKLPCPLHPWARLHPCRVTPGSWPTHSHCTAAFCICQGLYLYLYHDFSLHFCHNLRSHLGHNLNLYLCQYLSLSLCHYLRSMQCWGRIDILCKKKSKKLERHKITWSNCRCKVWGSKTLRASAQTAVKHFVFFVIYNCISLMILFQFVSQSIFVFVFGKAKSVEQKSCEHLRKQLSR